MMIVKYDLLMSIYMSSTKQIPVQYPNVANLKNTDFNFNIGKIRNLLCSSVSFPPSKLGVSACDPICTCIVRTVDTNTVHIRYMLVHVQAALQCAWKELSKEALLSMIS